MGSSKTANALMVRYNYEERGQEALMVKPAIDQRDGARVIVSRIGLRWPCVYFHEPDRPVRTTSLSRGMERSIFLRLCTRAPLT